MAGFSLPPQGADPRKHDIFFLLPAQFLLIKGVCSPACAGIGALSAAAALAAMGVPRQGCSFSPSCHCSGSHDTTTKDRQSFVSSDSSVFTQLHGHGPLPKLGYLSCWRTQAQAGSLLLKSETNATSSVTCHSSPVTARLSARCIPSRFK